MPASMVHLLTARKVDENAPVLFYIGNIAPDAVSEWKLKDKTHFRDLDDRTDILTGLALRTNAADPFSQGVLLHLFLDWKWDLAPFAQLKEKRAHTDWFTAYRKELSSSGLWLYHHTAWSRPLWEAMASVDPALYGSLDYLTAEDIGKYIRHNFSWHEENKEGPSEVFTPEFVEGFARKTAEEFI